MKIFLSILLRDVTVARRELMSFLVRTTMQPILLVFVFGFVLPRMGFVNRAFTSAMLPGIVAMSLTLSAIQSVALPMVAEFGFTKEIEDRLLAPIGTHWIAIEKIVAGAIQGAVAAAFVLPIGRLIMGPVPGLTFRNAPLAALIVILGGAAFSAIGLFLGTAISPQQVGLMFSVIIAPMIFFGCTYYPWRGLSVLPVLQYAVLANPLVYVSEGMRAALTPSTPHMPVAAVLAALVGVIAVFTWLGLRSFRRRAIS